MRTTTEGSPKGAARLCGRKVSSKAKKAFKKLIMSTRKDALLYIFYGSPATCANRLRIFRELNPDLKIFGICTAGISQKSKFKVVEDQCDHLWYLPDHDSKWCWYNLDKVACMWFEDAGVYLDFEKILVVDWDLLLLEPVKNWLDQVGDNEVKIIDVWENKNPRENYWTSDRYPEYNLFKDKLFSENSNGYVLLNAFLFAYACKKSSFAKFAPQVISLPGYCEFRLPTVMASCGLTVTNFNRPKNWGEFSTVSGLSIPRRVIKKELSNHKGFRMFHPVYEPYYNAKLDISITAVIRDGSWWRSFSRSAKNLVRRFRQTFLGYKI